MAQETTGCPICPYTWVGLTQILSVLLPAHFLPGLMEFGRSGWTPCKGVGSEAIERLRFLASSLLPVPGRRKEARKRNLSIASNPVSVDSKMLSDCQLLACYQPEPPNSLFPPTYGQRTRRGAGGGDGVCICPSFHDSLGEGNEGRDEMIGFFPRLISATATVAFLLPQHGQQKGVHCCDAFNS